VPHERKRRPGQGAARYRQERRISHQMHYCYSAAASTRARTPSNSSHTSRVDPATPITCAKFWRNRRGEAVHVRLGKYKDTALDIRVFRSDQSGYMWPSTKGIAVMMAKLPELKAAIDKARQDMSRLGLLGRPIDEDAPR
jgi:hypothetical protein